jgi:hypothetical protein
MHPSISLAIRKAELQSEITRTLAVVLPQGAAILQQIPIQGEVLPVRRNARLIVDPLLDTVDGSSRTSLRADDGLAPERTGSVNLYMRPISRPWEVEVQIKGTLLWADVVVGQGAAVH